MTKHISELIPSLGQDYSDEKSIDPKAVDIVNKLFTFFYGSCRGFEKQFRDTNKLKIEKAQWFKCFSDENFTDMRRINFGMRKCRLESPINIPTIADFILWCTPTAADLGLLSKEQAYLRCAQMMRDGNIDDLSEAQNLLLKHVITQSDSYFLRNAPENKTQPVFYRNYDIAIRDFINGKLQAIPKAIEDNHHESIEIQKKAAIKKTFGHLKGYEQNMEEIKKILGMANGSDTNR